MDMFYLQLFFFQDLSHNRLITLTPGVGFLNRLKHVNLSNNELHSIPHELTAVCGMVISLLLCHFFFQFYRRAYKSNRKINTISSNCLKQLSRIIQYPIVNYNYRLGGESTININLGLKWICTDKIAVGLSFAVSKPAAMKFTLILNMFLRFENLKLICIRSQYFLPSTDQALFKGVYRQNVDFWSRKDPNCCCATSTVKILCSIWTVSACSLCLFRLV